MLGKIIRLIKQMTKLQKTIGIVGLLVFPPILLILGNSYLWTVVLTLLGTFMLEIIVYTFMISKDLGDMG